MKVMLVGEFKVVLVGRGRAKGWGWARMCSREDLAAVQRRAVGGSTGRTPTETQLSFFSHLALGDAGRRATRSLIKLWLTPMVDNHKVQRSAYDNTGFG